MKSELEKCLIIEEESFLSDISEHYSSAEKRLLFAVLERAVRDFLSTNEEEKATARIWLEDIEGSDPFSFPWICEMLELNCNQLLDRIYRIKGFSEKVRNASREVYALIELTNKEKELAVAA